MANENIQSPLPILSSRQENIIGVHGKAQSIGDDNGNKSGNDTLDDINVIINKYNNLDIPVNSVNNNIKKEDSSSQIKSKVDINKFINSDMPHKPLLDYNSKKDNSSNYNHGSNIEINKNENENLKDIFEQFTKSQTKNEETPNQPYYLTHSKSNINNENTKNYHSNVDKSLKNDSKNNSITNINSADEDLIGKNLEYKMQIKLLAEENKKLINMINNTTNKIDESYNNSPNPNSISKYNDDYSFSFKPNIDFPLKQNEIIKEHKTLKSAHVGQTGEIREIKEKLIKNDLKDIKTSQNSHLSQISRISKQSLGSNQSEIQNFNNLDIENINHEEVQTIHEEKKNTYENEDIDNMNLVNTENEKEKDNSENKKEIEVHNFEDKKVDTPSNYDRNLLNNESSGFYFRPKINEQIKEKEESSTTSDKRFKTYLDEFIPKKNNYSQIHKKQREVLENKLKSKNCGLNKKRYELCCKVHCSHSKGGDPQYLHINSTTSNNISLKEKENLNKKSPSQNIPNFTIHKDIFQNTKNSKTPYLFPLNNESEEEMKMKSMKDNIINSNSKEILPIPENNLDKISEKGETEEDFHTNNTSKNSLFLSNKIPQGQSELKEKNQYNKMIQDVQTKLNLPLKKCRKNQINELTNQLKDLCDSIEKDKIQLENEINLDAIKSNKEQKQTEKNLKNVPNNEKNKENKKNSNDSKVSPKNVLLNSNSLKNVKSGGNISNNRNQDNSHLLGNMGNNAISNYSYNNYVKSKISKNSDDTNFPLKPEIYTSSNSKDKYFTLNPDTKMQKTMQVNNSSSNKLNNFIQGNQVPSSINNSLNFNQYIQRENENYGGGIIQNKNLSNSGRTLADLIDRHKIKENLKNYIFAGNLSKIH